MLLLHRGDVRHLGRQGRLLSERVLVTGALGCLGAWAVKAVLEDGDEPVGYDLGDAMHRLELILSPEERERLTLVRGDITDLEAFGRALDEHAITRVVHLAGLQVPFCRADPVLGARVNVVGTVNVFEAVKERLDRIPGVAYASSAAVYGPDDPSPAPESGGTAPGTIYGVYKLANEGTARLYQAESGVPSIGIRPICRLRAGPRPGNDRGADAGDGGSRPRRGLRDWLRRRRPVRLRARRQPRVRPRRLGVLRRSRRELPGSQRLDGRGCRSDRSRSAGGCGADQLGRKYRCRFRRRSKCARSRKRSAPSRSRHSLRASTRRLLTFAALSLLTYFLVRRQTKEDVMISRTVTAVLAAPKEQVFDYLSKIENLPAWASEFARELKYEDGKAKVVNGLGEFYFAIEADAKTGVIDMYAGPTEDELGLFPTRVVGLPGDTSAFSFTMFQAPGMPDELFESQYQSLLREFDNIRSEFAA